jgi:hypothetical protein
MIHGRPRYVPHPNRPHRYDLNDGAGWRCACGKLQDDAAVKRGRNNRARGGRAELDIARTYGGEKVGPLGLPEDIRGKSWRTQVKVSQRGVPPAWLREFTKMDTHRDGRTPRLILRFTRQGVRAQDFVVIRGEDWLAWFGKDE